MVINIFVHVHAWVIQRRITYVPAMKVPLRETMRQKQLKCCDARTCIIGMVYGHMLLYLQHTYIHTYIHTYMHIYIYVHGS